MKWMSPSPRRVRGVVALLIFSPALAITLAGEQSDLDGVWYAGRLGEVEDPHFTSAGEAAFASYDYLTDDPAMRCIPASFTRVMHTPSPPIEIKRNEDHIEINYEFMDIRRRVPLDPTQTLENAPFTVAEHPHMGRSIGRYDGETLVIETAGQQAGVLDTLGIAGLPQSGEMRTEERFLADGDNLKVVVTHYDPVNYSEPLVVRYEFIRLDSEILEWGCTVDEASYERFSDIPQ